MSQDGNTRGASKQSGGLGYSCGEMGWRCESLGTKMILHPPKKDDRDYCFLVARCNC